MKIRIRKPRKFSKYIPPPRYPYSEHTGFWLSDGEQSVHVYGDANMSEETANAPIELVKCAYEAIDNGLLEAIPRKKKPSVKDEL